MSENLDPVTNESPGDPKPSEKDSEETQPQENERKPADEPQQPPAPEDETDKPIDAEEKPALEVDESKDPKQEPEEPKEPQSEPSADKDLALEPPKEKPAEPAEDIKKPAEPTEPIHVEVKVEDHLKAPEEGTVELTPLERTILGDGTLQEIPEDFYYEDVTPLGAVVSEESGLPENLLEMVHSFGYDCLRRSNLYVIDAETIAYIAGNMILFENLTTHERIYLRSSGGGGIGAMAVYPNSEFIAIAEKGIKPVINIYRYPSLQLYRILRNGTERSYAWVSFSPDARLLASVGGAPDYMLTLWNWKHERILLNSKAFAQDVFRVTFSTDLEGLLTTAGSGHIRFWKMADTFTGLKLEGELGRFSKTEISDIEGYVELPDGKVLSSSEWGDMLLWEGGLIKAEVCRKGKKPCHNGPIEQILLDEGEIFSVGLDGCIRVWDFETIDTAEIIEEAELFEMEPMNELKVSAQAKLNCIIKSPEQSEESSFWFAQDKNGSIWKLDLSFSYTAASPEQVFQFHAGPIMGCQMSPCTNLIATIGDDGVVCITDYLLRQTICRNKYVAAGTQVIWAPANISKNCATLYTSFADGVLRLLRFVRTENKSDIYHRKVDTSQLLLLQVYKPHKGRITTMRLSPDNDVLVTGSEDSTVFFFGVQNERELTPLGFVNVEAKVTNMQWCPNKSDFESRKLLVVCDNGTAVEVSTPTMDSVDNSSSYELEKRILKRLTFESVKSELLHDQELAEQREIEEARKRQEEEERQERIERGLEEEEEEQTEVDSEPTAATEKTEKSKETKKVEEEEEEFVPYIPEVPSSVLFGMYDPVDDLTQDIWLSMDDYDAGYLYQCKLNDEEGKPSSIVPVEGIEGTPITIMKFSSDGKRVYMGLNDGRIRVQVLGEPYDLNRLGPYWMLSMHDNTQGAISDFAINRDEKFLITVGQDGNIFLYTVMSQEKMEIEVKKAKIPYAEEKDLIQVDDIKDPNTYSLEDAKQKAEHDRMLALAEEKKQEVRNTIEVLRDQFAKLVMTNSKFPEHMRLTSNDFEITSVIREDLEKDIQGKLQDLKLQMAWESEKCQIAVNKVKNRFKSLLECEHIVVKAFQTAHFLTTLRGNKHPEEFFETQKMLENLAIVQKPSSEATAEQEASFSQSERESSLLTVKAPAEDKSQKVVLSKALGERIERQLKRVEQKKAKNLARKKQWDELYAACPGDDYEDPEDVKAIQNAKDHIGDYKLKSSEDYVVPDHMRMNVNKARKRLLNIKDAILDRKQRFNKKVLELREFKIDVVNQVNEYVKQLDELASELPYNEEQEVLQVPSKLELAKSEVPENRLTYNRNTLLELKASKQGGQRTVDRKQTTVGFAQEPMRITSTPATKKVQSSKSRIAGPSQQQLLPKLKLEQLVENAESSEEQNALKHLETIRKIYQQKHFLFKIDQLLDEFDRKLHNTLDEFFELLVELKNADLRQVTLFEELILLKEYEKRENELIDKRETRMTEKNDMTIKVTESQNKITQKQKEIDRLTEKQNNLWTSFQATLGENNKFADFLTKVFKKKIKRSKKKDAEGDSDDEESSSSDESDFDESDEESLSDAPQYDLDICPNGCDQALYDSTCQFREKRLDIEEGVSEERKNLETIKKDNENLQKKAKLAVNALEVAENDLEAFQLEKQHRINQLDVVVMLRLDQIYFHEDGSLQYDLSPCLVFEDTVLNELKDRIVELNKERKVQKKQMQESKKRHVQLIKGRKKFQENIEKFEEKCRVEMVAKFGKEVDVKVLEQIIVNRNVEALKERIRQTGLETDAIMRDWEKKLDQKKSDIQVLLKENTNLLKNMNFATCESNRLEAQLDANQVKLGNEYAKEKLSDQKDRQKLNQLVQLQAEEIDALKEEIFLLSRKTGHILPPTQAPSTPTGAAGGGYFG